MNSVVWTWHKDQEHLPTFSHFDFTFPIQTADVGKIDLKYIHIVQQLSLYIWKLGVPAQIKSNFMLVYMVFVILHIYFFDILGILDGHASWIGVRVFVFWHISFIY